MIEPNKVDALYNELKSLADKRGYFLNPDVDFAEALTESLVVNEDRYGYQACPCRLATGNRAEDLDIICPCDYRDSDISEFGACYCGLYVDRAIYEGKQELKPIPERRKPKEERNVMANSNSKLETQNSELPIWRCTVCGYLCARNEAPEICPICGVAHDRFELF